MGTNFNISTSHGQYKDIVIATDSGHIFIATADGPDAGQLVRANYAAQKETNHAPEVSVALGAVAARVGEALQLTVPTNTFTDYNPDQSLTLALSGLPPGLAWNPTNRTLSITPITNGVFPLLLTATDNGSPPLSATNAFDLVVALPPVLRLAGATNGLFLPFTAEGPPGTTVTVEESVDLVNWSAWRSFVPTNSDAMLFTPPMSEGMRFYRLLYQE